MTGSRSSCRRTSADLKIHDPSRRPSTQFVFDDGLELIFSRWNLTSQSDVVLGKEVHDRRLGSIVKVESISPFLEDFSFLVEQGHILRVPDFVEALLFARKYIDGFIVN